jgi:hypothetical protein
MFPKAAMRANPKRHHTTCSTHFWDEAKRAVVPWFKAQTGGQNNLIEEEQKT